MEKLTDLSLDCLPESVQSIADVIGLADTIALVKAIGGSRFKFGKGKHNTARLALLHEAIGKPQTEKLLAVFGGDVMYIPRCQLALQRLRNQRFRADYAALTDNGKTSKAMALLQLLPKYQISNRTADAILQEREVLKVAQGDLF
ncbi:Mor transcription activator family protein [Kingella kingae]|uniref:Mor transcription activator family protein n=4 Tax=Kingella kingae TaxID=504 RepID=UPI00254B811C|nr:Mor transcription activator family protein [Kingella kingae]MDK4583302.1 Mor transcription activator family protein [Kingella kingae]MDK4645127.1 Mor transcription activator family protein [Kingella kingae]MDK4647266.1 Mor transcription activator family protein [Kingella kingae]MDK4662975.1 Mor transcription activator family protein [Kingella kingae]MDK4664983.1 Mor transcription activator family protein [Kingella kingae]